MYILYYNHTILSSYQVQNITQLVGKMLIHCLVPVFLLIFLVYIYLDVSFKIKYIVQIQTSASYFHGDSRTALADRWTDGRTYIHDRIMEQLQPCYCQDGTRICWNCCWNLNNTYIRSKARS